MASTYYTQVCTCTHQQTTLPCFQGLFWEGNWNCLPQEHTAATAGKTHGSNVCDVVGMWVCVGVTSCVYLAVELPKLCISPVNIPLLRLHLDKHLQVVVKLHVTVFGCDLTLLPLCVKGLNHIHIRPHALTVVTRLIYTRLHALTVAKGLNDTHTHHTW